MADIRLGKLAVVLCDSIAGAIDLPTGPTADVPYRYTETSYR